METHLSLVTEKVSKQMFRNLRLWLIGWRETVREPRHLCCLQKGFLWRKRDRIGTENWTQMNYLCDLGYLLYAEDKVILTSQMCCESLPKRSNWAWKSDVQGKKKFWLTGERIWACVLWHLTVLLSVFTYPLIVIVLFLFLISYGLASLSSTFSVFLPSYILLPLLMKTEVKFSGFWLLYHQRAKL